MLNPAQLARNNIHYTGTDLQLAKSFQEDIIAALKDELLSIPLSWVSRALRDHQWDSSYIGYWIALENLFGADDGREMTHKMSHRIVMFLYGDKLTRSERFKRVKKLYELRSKVVHGGKIAKIAGGEIAVMIKDCEEILWLSLRRILSDKELIKTFSSSGREDYLNDTLF